MMLNLFIIRYSTHLTSMILCMLKSKWKKEKSSSSLTTYTNLKNKHFIDRINAKTMFTHDKIISIQHNSKSLLSQ